MAQQWASGSHRGISVVSLIFPR